MSVFKRLIFIFAILSAFVGLSAISANAEYSFNYDSEQGFDIPYSEVNSDELSEPEYAVGEVHYKSFLDSTFYI